MKQNTRFTKKQNTVDRGIHINKIRIENTYKVISLGIFVDGSCDLIKEVKQ